MKEVSENFVYLEFCFAIPFLSYYYAKLLLNLFSSSSSAYRFIIFPKTVQFLVIRVFF